MDMGLLDTTALRRGAWVTVGLVGLPGVALGFLYLIGVPVALLAFAAGFVAGRSSRAHGVSFVMWAFAAFYLAGWASDRTSGGAVLLAVSALAALAAVYKLGNVSRLHLSMR